MNKPINRNLKLGFGISLIVLLMAGIISWQMLRSMIKSNEIVRHTNEVIQLLEQTISYIKDAETGQRGYLLTGQDRFLEPYRGATKQALLLADSVKKISADNPVQQKNIQLIRSIIIKRLAVLQEVISKRANGQQIAEADLERGKQAMDDLRRAISVAESDEHRLLTIRSEMLRHHRHMASIFIPAGILLSLIISILSYVRIINDLIEKENIYKALVDEKEQTAALNEELSTSSEEISAANEELLSINEELMIARQNLIEANNDLEQKVEKRTHELRASEKIAKELSEQLILSNRELTTSNQEIRANNDELVNLNQRLADSQQRYNVLLNAIPQQVWSTTADGKLDYVNAVAVEDFGKPDTVLINQGWQDMVHAEDLPVAIELWNRALSSGKEFHAEYRLRLANDVYYWHLARAFPLLENGSPVAWIGTNTNIHSQKIKEFQKDEFLSIASHELNTPLTTIKAFFQLLKQDIDGGSKMGGFIGKAEKQVDRLARLIDNLLDVSKINAGKMTYNLVEFDFNQLLRDVVESTQETAKNHYVELHAEGKVMINGDPDRLEQVIINLVNNATKYSPNADKIIVRSEIDQRNVIVSVQDYGIGIAQEHLKDLFSRFYRVDNTSARFQGLGLGLFISAEIIKRHGGSFWIESKVGEGSTFYFLLPLSGVIECAEISTDHKSYYHSECIGIRYVPEKEFLDVDWLGYQNYDSVVRGCMIILDLMKINNCRKILNNNSLVKGNWSEASDWGAEFWFPEMARSGLKKFAWIYSPSTFSRIAANKSLPTKLNGVEVAFFEDKETALKWLNSM
ncbi:MAG: CHASE3 domain-containing protein [Mucilaginibacter sp.]|nr:CHASE3 domain-containing protein [Mucilaginibacter sp.]